MNALAQTFTDFAAALRLSVNPNTPYHGGETFARLPRQKLVIDEDTGETVGTVRQWPTQVEWMSGSFGGYVDTMEEALACIERETIIRRGRVA